MLRWRWRRLAGLIAGVLLAGYLAGVTGIFAFARRVRGIDVAWTDVAWPPHWPRYAVARGEKFHAEAKRAFAQGMWREALVFSRRGVLLAPANRDGRLLHARMLFAAKRPTDGRQILLEGMACHAHDPLFLRTLLGFLLEVQEDAHVVAQARRVLATSPADRDVAAIAAIGGAMASFYRGHFDAAEDFLALAPPSVAARDVRLLRARIEWERGARESALRELRQLGREWPDDYEVHRELAGCLRRQGRTDEARRVVLTFQISRPDLAAARIDLMQAYRALEAREAEQREVEAFFAEHGKSEAALLLLGDFAATNGDVALVRRLRAHAAENALAGEHFDFLLAEACVVKGDFAGALAALRATADATGERGHGRRATLNSLRAIALYGAGERIAAEHALNELLAAPQLRAEKIAAAANRLIALGETDAARRLLLRVLEIDPHNQPALTRLVEIELEGGRIVPLAVHLRRLLKMRRPSLDLLRVARLRLGSDAFLFSEEATAALREVEAALAGRG